MVFRAAQEAGSLGVAEVAGDLDAAHEFVRSVVESGPGERPGGGGLIHRWLKNRRKKESDLEAPLLRVDVDRSASPAILQPSSSSSRSAAPSEDLGGYLGYTLFGALAVLPSFGPENLMKHQSKVFKWWFHVIFAAWWSSIGLGVTSSQDPPFQSLLVYARLAARLGIIGLTALVILYCHLLLAPDAKTTLYTMLTLAMVLHLSFWIADCCGRRLGR